MPSFQGGPNFHAPFGRNQFLRSTKDLKTLSYTAAASKVTSVTIDGWPNQKVLPTGVLMARITSGADVGKVGPYQPATGAPVQTVTITGTPTGGTFALDIDGEVTGPIAFNATAAAVQAALEALPAVQAAGSDVKATGGALPGSAVTLTWQAAVPDTDEEVAQSSGGSFSAGTPNLTVVESALTGGASPAVAIATTGGVGTTAGATDGRQDFRNIVGINNTFLPWQMEFRDVEIACVTDCLAVQAWCLMYDGAGNLVEFDSNTALLLAQGAGDPSLNLRFV